MAVVSEVPTPWICLRQDLRLAGVDPATIQLSAPRTMADNVACLRAAEVDVIQVFEPHTQQLLDEGSGHLWYAAASRGLSTYTTLNTTRGFLERHPDTALRMTRALYRTLQRIERHDGAALARSVADWFPSLPAPTLAACCTHYQSRGLWNSQPLMARAGFEWLREAMYAGGEVARRIEFEECIDMRFAEQAVAQGVPPL